MAIPGDVIPNTLQVMRYAPIVQQEAPSVGTWCRWNEANAIYSQVAAQNKEMRALLMQYIEAEQAEGGRGSYDLQTVVSDAIFDYMQVKKEWID